jgi:hypothetical protein
MMKKFGIIILIALCHFGLCVLIVPMTMSVYSTMTSQQPHLSPVIRLLVQLTGILHFPIISLSLYPRMWFPGNWIYFPIAMNSLIVAVGIYFLVIMGRKMFKKKNRT